MEALQRAVPALIDPNYKTPYALHATGGFEHAFNPNWMVSVDFTHEQGVHAYRRYDYSTPAVTVFRTDNRSRYDALSVHLQGNVSRRFHLNLNYTYASAETWGCQIGELFDYVNGVCDPLNAFAKGDYGPSGEDVRHRAVLAGTFFAPWGFELTTLSQVESARPFTMTTPVGTRAVVNNAETTLDQFLGTPFFQVDLRVSRPIKIQDRWTIYPFAEFFNLFNRSNPGNNYISDLAALPVRVNDLSLHGLLPQCELLAVTGNYQPQSAPCPGRRPRRLLQPGTTVGIPFAAQLGIRLSF